MQIANLTNQPAGAVLAGRSGIRMSSVMLPRAVDAGRRPQFPSSQVRDPTSVGCLLLQPPAIRARRPTLTSQPHISPVQMAGVKFHTRLGARRITPRQLVGEHDGDGDEVSVQLVSGSVSPRCCLLAEWQRKTAGKGLALARDLVIND